MEDGILSVQSRHKYRVTLFITVHADDRRPGSTACAQKAPEITEIGEDTVADLVTIRFEH